MRRAHSGLDLVRRRNRGKPRASVIRGSRGRWRGRGRGAEQERK